MKSTKKTVSVILIASMLMTLGACQDKSIDEVLDLAEEVANYTCDMDYKKLSKLTEDGDEKLEERFESIEEDDFKKAIAATLEFEFDEDSLEKDGKNGYTVEVTFTYVDYEEVMDGRGFTDLADWEDAIDDCDEVIEEDITLEFEKDGSDILFVNIDDLEDLFKYYDEDITGCLVDGGDAAVESDDDVDSAGTDDTDPTPAPTAAPTTAPTTAPTAATTYDSDYPNPGDYYQEGVCMMLHDTNILFTYPEGTTIYGDEYTSPDDFIMLYGWDSNMSHSYYITQGSNFSCYDEFVLELREDTIDDLAEYTMYYESHTISTLTMTVGDYTYDGLLAEVVSERGEITYIYVVMVGNEGIYYNVTIQSDDMDFIYDTMSCFSYVE